MAYISFFDDCGRPEQLSGPFDTLESAMHKSIQDYCVGTEDWMPADDDFVWHNEMPGVWYFMNRGDNGRSYVAEIDDCASASKTAARICAAG